jgi:DNA polymerase-3 subunit delta
VTTEDVMLLTAQEHEGNIFDLVDAIGERNGKAALSQLQILLERSDALEISGMITRQYRLLLQAREILEEGGGENQVRDELNLHPFVAQKLTSQARRFKIGQLEDIYRRLLKIDLDIKTGGMPGDVAYEVLVTELAGG